MEKATFLACLCCTLSSCSNVEKKADERLQTARTVFKRGDYSEARMQIDSTKTLYPKAFETRREGIGLIQQVELKGQEKTLAYFDNMLQERQEAVDATKGSYAFEKDAEHQRIDNYLHPSQVIEKNLHRSYLRFQVDENGAMSMTSIYYGPHNTHHLVMKVIAPDDSFAETPASKDSYETTDLEEKIEKAGYKAGEDDNVIVFFNLNKDRNIRVNYLGERPHAITMTPNGRKTVAAVYELVQLPSAITEIKKNKDEVNPETEFVKRKMAERESREKEQVLECRPSTLPL